MTTFIETFKAKAHSKTITASDIIALCIYKTVKAKSEDKVTILKHFLKKAFSAGRVCSHRPYPYYTIINTMYYLNRQRLPGKRWGPDGWTETNGYVLSVEINEILTEEEQTAFNEIARMIDSEFVMGL